MVINWKSNARSIALASALVTGSLGMASAGPYAEFEHALSAAYAPYRTALFQTNQKDRQGTEASIAAFETRWLDLMKKWRVAPPPQYADDPKWPETIAAIEQTVAAAKSEVGKGELAKAHDVLERIRDELGKLRNRNGVTTFSDRMDAYHEHMEHVLTAKPAGNEPDGIGRLRETAAVLVHLAGLVAANAPSSLTRDPAFNESLNTMKGSADALLAATRKGDRSAIEQAMKALKPAYSRMFVKYG